MKETLTHVMVAELACPYCHSGIAVTDKVLSGTTVNCKACGESSLIGDYSENYGLHMEKKPGTGKVIELSGSADERRGIRIDVLKNLVSIFSEDLPQEEFIAMVNEAYLENALLNSQ